MMVLKGKFVSCRYWANVTKTKLQVGTFDCYMILVEFIGSTVVKN